MSDTLPKEAAGRPFKSALDARTLSEVQNGVLRTRYRGRRMLKSPFDLVLYIQLLERLRPRTIVEIGSREGGSALWFADTTAAMGHPARVISIDLELPASAMGAQVEFRAGDANDLALAITPEELSTLPHPWLITEDSAHTRETCLAALAFFDPWLSVGDYIVIEDGIVSDMAGPQYARFADGPNRAVAEFLRSNANRYEIDASLCDFFGHNVTYSPNGWLKRV